jgi:hypothetical protein
VRVLVVYWWPADRGKRLGIESHLRALERLNTDVTYVNAVDARTRETRRGAYDGIVLHTTFLCRRWASGFERFRREWHWLSAHRCPIVALPQDEYRYAEVLDEWLDELGVDVVFSCFDEPLRDLIYKRTRADFRLGLTGYLDPETAAYCDARSPPAGQRPYDIVYRASRLPFWLGRHSQLKHEIGVATAERAGRHGLKVDISSRLESMKFGNEWLDFLLSGHATVGAESGSSVLDRRGEIERRAREIAALDPRPMSFAEFERRMPAGWDSYAFFALGPRHLEAVLSRTCQILVEGRYSGVLQANRHYLPVQPDFSDLDEVLERVRDRSLTRELADRAYEEVYLRGRWTTDDFAAELLSALGERRVSRSRRSIARARAAPVVSTVDAAQARVEAVTAGPLTRVRHARVAGRALAARPRLAMSIARALLTSPRQAPSLRAIARDLLRLGALDRFEEQQRTHGGPWRVQAAVHDGRLQLTSEAGGRNLNGTVSGPVRTIDWDHSRFGPVVSLAGKSSHTIPVGEDGRWRFEALSELACRSTGVDWVRLALTGNGEASTGARREQARAGQR